MAEARAQPGLGTAASTAVEVEQDGALQKYLLVRDENALGLCYYLGSSFHLQGPVSTEGQRSAIRLIRYDYRKGAEGNESLTGAILNFTATWEAPPDMTGRLKPAAAKLAGVAKDKVRLHPLPLTDLSVTLLRPGAKAEAGVPATTRAVYTVGNTGVTATLQLETLETSLANTLVESRIGLVVVIQGSYAGLSADGKPGTRRVELRGAIGVGALPEDVRKGAVENLTDWVSAAYLVPPAVGLDLGLERVTIDVTLGDAAGERKA